MFTQQIASSQGEQVYLVRGKDEGQEAWHYVLVDKLKLPLFLAKIKQGSLDVAEYGKVLYSGWGSNPPQDIIDAIKQLYES